MRFCTKYVLDGPFFCKNMEPHITLTKRDVCTAHSRADTRLLAVERNQGHGEASRLRTPGSQHAQLLAQRAGNPR
jgi:hypothetical protein